MKVQRDIQYTTSTDLSNTPSKEWDMSMSHVKEELGSIYESINDKMANVQANTPEYARLLRNSYIIREAYETLQDIK